MLLTLKAPCKPLTHHSLWSIRPREPRGSSQAVISVKRRFPQRSWCFAADRTVLNTGRGRPPTLPTAAFAALLPLKPAVQISQQQWVFFTFSFSLSALPIYFIFYPCYNQEKTKWTPASDTKNRNPAHLSIPALAEVKCSRNMVLGRRAFSALGVLCAEVLIARRHPQNSSSLIQSLTFQWTDSRI